MTHTIEFSRSLQGVPVNEKFQIKQLRNKGSIQANMLLPNCLFVDTAAHLIAEPLGRLVEKKQIVWRCISRLEHGKKYCPDSPTIKEENLHQGIIKAINNYYSCRNDIARILKANIGTVLECQGQEEIIAAENRLKEIDRARNELVGLIATGGCDEDKLDSEFEKLYEEEQSLSERLAMLKSKNQTSAETQAKLDKTIDMIEHEKFELETFDNVLIRKLIECVKVLNKAEILVIFKGGYEVRKEIE